MGRLQRHLLVTPLLQFLSQPIQNSGCSTEVLAVWNLAIELADNGSDYAVAIGAQYQAVGPRLLLNRATGMLPANPYTIANP